MLKPSRSRALDTARSLQIFRREDVNDVDIQAARGIQYVFTGMEKAEEEEKHLQEILTAQVLGLQKHQEDLVIPTPEFSLVEDHSKLYKNNWRKPGQYVHAQPFFYEDYPAYDMDEEDKRFLNQDVRDRWKLDLSDTVFEEMISQLEVNSGSSTISLQEAKLLLKEDDDIILLVYEYWLKKKLRLQHNLVPTIRAEQVGCTLDKKNPYVAFRRRFEKMQTRRNRKSDENSYAVMLKLRRDLTRAVTLLSFVKKRERLKKAALELDLASLDKRVSAADWDGRMISEIKAIRKYRKLEEAALQESEDDISVAEDDISVAEDDVSVADSDYETDEGPFSFRRREGVEYLAPKEFTKRPVMKGEGRVGGRVDELKERMVAGRQEDKFIWTSVPGICASYCRRRVGRGGRVVVDRRDPVRRLGPGDWEGEAPGWIAEPRMAPNLQFVDWDPYKVRGEEIGDRSNNNLADKPPSSNGGDNMQHSPWRQRYRSGGMKTINMNRVGAHNAASALLNSQIIDLFNVSKNNGDC